MAFFLVDMSKEDISHSAQNHDSKSNLKNSSSPYLIFKPYPIEFNHNPITNKNTTCTCAKVAATVGIPWDEGCASTRVELHRPTRSLDRKSRWQLLESVKFFLRGKLKKTKENTYLVFFSFFFGVLRCLLLNLT